MLEREFTSTPNSKQVLLISRQESSPSNFLLTSWQDAATANSHNPKRQPAQPLSLAFALPCFGFCFFFLGELDAATRSDPKSKSRSLLREGE
jgi:hypothetical protein